MAGYTDTFNDGLDSYSLNAGLNSGGGLISQRQINAYYSHQSAGKFVREYCIPAERDIRLEASVLPVGQQLPEKGAALHAGGNCPVEHVFLLTRMVWRCTG